MTAATKIPAAFAVRKAPGNTDKWTITENGHFDCPVDWATRLEAQNALNRVRRQADNVAHTAGYYQTADPSKIHIYIVQEKIELVLPYGFTPSIRRQVIHLAAMQHYLDLEAGS